MLPIICESVVSIAVGGPVVRSELQKPLDSYQEDDLNNLKEKWSDALAKRKEYLDRQLKNILDKSAKTDAEHEREQLLVDQCVFLTEEQEYVMVPAPGSGVPGAPADNEPPEGMEQHSPVLFLDLNSDDLSTGKFFFAAVWKLFRWPYFAFAKNAYSMRHAYKAELDTSVRNCDAIKT